MGDRQWQARWNGRALTATDDVSQPYASLYRGLLGTPEQLRARTVPAEALVAGANHFELRLADGGAVTIEYLDLAVST